MRFIILGFFVVLFILTYALGMYVGRVRERAYRLSQLGLDRKTLDRYRRMVKVLTRMTEIRELDGDNAIDVLSVNTDKQVRGLLAEHRKKVDQG